MLYRITFMKAPWPAGAKVGDVVELAAVPAWALGKCEPAGDDAVATDFGGSAEGSGAALEAEAKAKAEAEALAAAEAEAAAKAAADARAALEAEATGLGVTFRSNISDETLAARIAEAKAAKQ